MLRQRKMAGQSPNKSTYNESFSSWPHLDCHLFRSSYHQE
jgi:hypothetical protein